MDLQAPLSLIGASTTYSRDMTCQTSHPPVYMEPHIDQDTAWDAYQCHEKDIIIAALRHNSYGHTENQKAVLRLGNYQALLVSQKAFGTTTAIATDIPALYDPPQTHLCKDAPR